MGSGRTRTRHHLRQEPDRALAAVVAKEERLGSLTDPAYLEAVKDLVLFVESFLSSDELRDLQLFKTNRLAKNERAFLGEFLESLRNHDEWIHGLRPRDDVFRSDEEIKRTFDVRLHQDERRRVRGRRPPQCSSVYSKRGTVVFCVKREGHTGDHRGTRKQWNDRGRLVKISQPLPI